MRNALIFMTLAAIVAVSSLPAAAAQTSQTAPTAQPARSALDIPRGIGSWDPESGLGNHRAVVRVGTLAPPASAVRVVIPWRRRDTAPDKKAVLVIDASTGTRVLNVATLSIDRESGDLVFEPKTAPGDYFVYFMPYKSEGRKNYPNVRYDAPAQTADPAWLAAAGIGPGAKPAALDALPRASAVEIQSTDEFSAFTPMEVTATAAERDAVLRAHPDDAYFLFPEDRRLSIRMTDDVPLRWVLVGPGIPFKSEAARGEYFTFQVGVWAARSPVEGVSVKIGDFRRISPAGQASAPAPSAPASPAVIPASSATCFNTAGVGWDGAKFTRTVSVERGKVQSLWCGLPISKDALPGVYEGTVTVVPNGLPPRSVAVSLRITYDVLADSGDSDPFRMTRLRWLDSTIAADDSIVPPYTPVTVDGMTVGVLGRTLELSPDGLPSRIRSFFAPELTRLQKKSVDLTAGPFRLAVLSPDGRELPWAGQRSGPRFTKKAEGAASWTAESRSPSSGLSMTVSASMEFDGFVHYRVSIGASRDAELGDIRLEIPFRDECARYMMGLGFKGGLRPASFDWTWDQKKNQDALWLGAANAGLQVSLRAENYSRPLNTNFYLSKPLNMPPSWWNEGRGSVAVRSAGPSRPGVVLLTAASGPRTIKAGETLHFDFTLLLTPFKPVDPASHFSERYFHDFKPLSEVQASGANVVNIHHANAVNPYINYPFLRPAEMKAYIDEAHRRGMKVKIYDTVRELSNHAAELFALRSLGHEIFTPGPGGGYSWLQEHFGADYIAAWFVPDLRDAAVINSGMSRWHNYYLEGLDWLTRNVGIDGLYLDDVAFDRTTMKRLRKIFDRRRPGCLIDLHSANQYNPRDGFASSANLYLEHFPFLNRLWFGEYFDYNGSRPDYWLVEMSGLPFGLMGEMLQDGGNPWRGMVFGMTSRLPWAGDPRPLWKVWDAFGIASAEMFGWWADSCPVKTGNPDVLATVYMRKGKAALVALASWAKEPADVRLAVNWKALGLDPKKAALTAPAIDKFQPAASFKPGDPIRVEPGRGWLLVLQ